MFDEKLIDVLIKFMMAFLLNAILLIIFVVLSVVAIKIKKLTYYNAIDFRQNFIAFSFSLFVFALFPVYISAFVWVGIYFFLKEIVFKKDEARKYKLYSQFGKKTGYPFPKMYKIAQYKQTFFSVDNKLRYKDFKYSFLSYANTGVCLIVFLLLKITEISNVINILYFIEVIIIASIIYVFVGKFVYHISLYAPNSLTYLCVRGSYIPVVLVGLLYYFVIVTILFAVHGTLLFTL